MCARARVSLRVSRCVCLCLAVSVCVLFVAGKAHALVSPRQTQVVHHMHCRLSSPTAYPFVLGHLPLGLPLLSSGKYVERWHRWFGSAAELQTKWARDMSYFLDAAILCSSTPPLPEQPLGCHCNPRVNGSNGGARSAALGLPVDLTGSWPQSACREVCIDLGGATLSARDNFIMLLCCASSYISFPVRFTIIAPKRGEISFALKYDYPVDRNINCNFALVNSSASQGCQA